MLKRFDHIIKSALEGYVAHHIPDWDVFYDLLLTEQDAPLADEDVDQEVGVLLLDLDYSTKPSSWGIFESRLDDLNSELDDKFDQSVGKTLLNVSDETWGKGHWDMMLSRLDDLNKELDQEFDQNVNEALVKLPEAAWKESHWQMLSARLDRLNDRPRLLLMKVIEAAAILLILIQLTTLYSDYQRTNGRDNLFLSFIEALFESDKDKDLKDGDIIVLPNSFPPIEKVEEHQTVDDQEFDNEGTLKVYDDSDLSHELNKNLTIPKETQGGLKGIVPNGSLNREDYRGSAEVMLLPVDNNDRIKYNYLKDWQEVLNARVNNRDSRISPNLDMDPNLIAYNNTPSRLDNPTRLGVRDISLLTARASDSILTSIPTFQVITPRLYSSMEVGALADATTVEVQDFYSLGQEPFDVPTLNPGLYFRYKIQYKDMFGSLGSDILKIKYGGQNNINELAMVTLPFELGYNVVNLPALRMYFSGGVAGRFVPVARYSPDPYNQSSDYNRESNKESNGLLNNGPFEINSYLSGRLSLGLDINVNKKTSVNLRFSHDIWLKGRGIGYNLDKFRSSHLAIGANHHF